MMVGKALIKDQMEIHKIVILNKTQNGGLTHLKILKEIDMVEAGLKDVCSTFYFSSTVNEEILFTTKTQITALNFMENTTRVFYDFETEFLVPPNFF